jgi:hypothetical protein
MTNPLPGSRIDLARVGPELAATLTEVEREWLHAFLVDRYRLRA